MKKSLVLAMAMALGVSATAFAANPFSDVPAGHWAYASVSKLAAAGIVDGYPDGTFKGDNLMTRYEMAQIVAKAMAKGANVDKLAAEFADEMDNLGVRVANLEKKADNVKITGEFRTGYKDYDLGAYKPEGRTRLFVAARRSDPLAGRQTAAPWRAECSRGAAGALAAPRRGARPPSPPVNSHGRPAPARRRDLETA